MDVHGGIVQHDGRTALALERGCFAAEIAGVTLRFVAGIAPAAALLLLQACASSNSYKGIPLVAGRANPELQQLANRARAGDKKAQLELGIRFEEGRGVPVNVGQARGLYRQAESDSGGTMWVYSPPVRNGATGRVVPIDKGIMQPGLIDARQRLDALTRQAADRKVPQ